MLVVNSGSLSVLVFLCFCVQNDIQIKMLFTVTDCTVISCSCCGCGACTFPYRQPLTGRFFNWSPHRLSEWCLWILLFSSSPYNSTERAAVPCTSQIFKNKSANVIKLLSRPERIIVGTAVEEECVRPASPSNDPQHLNGDSLKSFKLILNTSLTEVL